MVGILGFVWWFGLFWLWLVVRRGIWLWRFGEEQGCSIDIFFLTGLFVSFDSVRFLFVCRNGFLATSCRSGSLFWQFANLRFLISNCSQLFCFVTARVTFLSIVFGVWKYVRRDGPGSFKASTLTDEFVFLVSVDCLPWSKRDRVRGRGLQVACARVYMYILGKSPLIFFSIFYNDKNI